jgi:predicted TPR repeat methyltransferase
VIDAILERFANGRCSAQVALMELLLACEDLPRVERAVAAVPALRALLAANRAGCERLLEGLKREPTPGQDMLSYQRALFDGWVARDEATSVAFYSLGNEALLEAATREIVSWLAPHLNPSMRVLDFGCGIGRIAAALAPQVRSIDGVDISANMIDAARRRVPSARFTQIEGRELRMFADGSFELALAVDSFPYLVDAGIADAMLDELRRVAAKIVILNYSYRGDPERDRQELARHFQVELTQPFALWNGCAFVLS